MRVFLSILCCLLCLWVISDAHAADRPNVVLIFIDDMGYGDVGFNGATGPKTPHLDQMAREGMRFDHFYVGCSVCTGSRTALLTGCHYERLSMRSVLFPNSNEGLHPDEVTLADMLGDSGYRTACVGKWHLGHLPPCLPTYQGFDSYYGIPYSNDMWIDPANTLADDILIREGLTLEEVKAGHKKRNLVPLMRDEEVIDYPADQATVTKRFTEESIRFITDHKDEPFFLYLPHTMVHVPLAVSEDFADRHDKLIWNAIEEVDWSVGQILDTLRDLGLSEKTLVIFTSDNGAAVGSSQPLRAKKFSVYEGGVREPTVMWWPGQIPADSVCTEVAATIDILPTLAQLCAADLPEQPIDGHDISPLLRGTEGAKSPHQYYTLMHQKGAVRSGPWKYYPWPETADKRNQNTPDRPLSTDPVQLYHVLDDISEQNNIAAKHPDIVKELHAAYEAHVDKIKSNLRPTAPLVRPEGALSADRPGGPKKPKPAKPIDWDKTRIGDVIPASQAPNVSGRAFTLSATIDSADAAGVLISHGGSAIGYSLYITAEKRAVFAIRSGKEGVSRLQVPLKGEAIRLTCGIDKEGKMFLQTNDDKAITIASRFLSRHPSEAMSIGHDEANAVDTQSPEAYYPGKLSDLRLE